MHDYEVAFEHYFGGYEAFRVEADNKAEAVEKARAEANLKCRDKCKTTAPKYVKKLNSNKKK